MLVLSDSFLEVKTFFSVIKELHPSLSVRFQFVHVNSHGVPQGSGPNVFLYAYLH